jgi:HD-GYP domain-containing protein (c-di-GMP phosphodiesterase class II)
MGITLFRRSSPGEPPQDGQEELSADNLRRHKIGIPDRVLRKPGPLDPDERRLMQTHTLMGERMLSDVALLRGEGLRVVRSHHERWGGLGYPDRLVGDEIPIGARVFAVADTLDALTNDRPYRAAGSWEDAAALIVAEAGG